jgi:hypothetical protein
VNSVTTVRTVEQTVTVRDSGEFLIPLDVKALATGVQVRPTEVRVLVHMPPLARIAGAVKAATLSRPR